jgi:LysR family transcriptional regulator, transcriptional activator of the cysJI operon
MIENFKLKVFRVVADTLNYRKAAEELHLTQPAVTAQIQSLEEGLGIALFDRMGRETRLTSAGATLLQYARRIESIANEAVAALAQFGGQESIELTIAASQTIAVDLLPMILPDVLRDWPQLRVHVIGGTADQVLQALTTHQAAVALIHTPAQRPDLKLEVFGEYEVALFARPDHRLAKKAVVTAAELVQERILLGGSRTGMRRFVEDYLEQNGILRQQLRTSVDMNSSHGVVSAVEAGLGIGIAPVIVAEKAIKMGIVRTLPLENGPIRGQLTIALPNGPEPRGPLRQLVQLLREYGAAHFSVQAQAKQRAKSGAGKIIGLGELRNEDKPEVLA